ncbi:hypothetical protein BB561_004462 [Smittium simulii]|uniref:SCP domain-containing protein n=1 Tax=Smittium simulii TaxID=133385 RepID=A0A2T9YG37_9FUNG|nr:hypothetical protein BB561_004462 [Smittium simulii]
MNVSNVKGSQDKDSQDMNVSDIKDSQDMNASDIKDSQDMNVSDIKGSQDINASDIKKIKDVDNQKNTTEDTSALISMDGFKSIYGDIEISEAEKLLNLINDLRKSEKLSILVLDEKLTKAAIFQAKYQNAVSKLTQKNFGFTNVNDRIKFTGNIKCPAGGCAENVASNMHSVKDVYNYWISDPESLKNILGNYKFMGIAKSKKYWVQNFS